MRILELDNGSGTSCLSTSYLAGDFNSRQSLFLHNVLVLVCKRIVTRTPNLRNVIQFCLLHNIMHAFMHP